MLRNITPAQKRTQKFYKSDTLAETNEMNCDCFFFACTENRKKLFSQNLKVEAKFPGTFFLDFILLFHNAVEKF